jgi:hypothetical protein
MANLEFSDVPLEGSSIGPLFASRIGPEPVSWGQTQDFVYADPEVGEYVEREAARLRLAALPTLRDELSALIMELRSGTEPQTVLHGFLQWGESSVPKVAGFLGKRVDDVQLTVQALSDLGVLKLSRLDGFGDVQFVVDPNAEVFAPTI